MKKKKSDHFLEVSKHLSREIEDSLKTLEKTLSEKYPFGIPRKEIGKATGNVLHPRTEANNDCSGDAIHGRFKVGRRMIYPVASVIQRIKSKMTLIA